MLTIPVSHPALWGCGHISVRTDLTWEIWGRKRFQCSFNRWSLNGLENKMRLTSRTCLARPLPGWAATFSQIQQSCITVEKRNYLSPWPQGTLNIQILVHWININNNNNNNRTYHLLSTCHLPGERSTYHLYSSYTFCKAGVTISTLQLRKLKFRKIMWFAGNHMPSQHENELGFIRHSTWWQSQQCHLS